MIQKSWFSLTKLEYLPVDKISPFMDGRGKYNLNASNDLLLLTETFQK